MSLHGRDWITPLESQHWEDSEILMIGNLSPQMATTSKSYSSPVLPFVCRGITKMQSALPPSETLVSNGVDLRLEMSKALVLAPAAYAPSLVSLFVPSPTHAAIAICCPKHFSHHYRRMTGSIRQLGLRNPERATANPDASLACDVHGRHGW